MLNVGYLTSDTTSSGDERYTPFYAVTPIVRHLKNSGYKTIWCPFDEEWSAYVRTFREEGFNFIRSSLSDGKDFFKYEPDEPYDVIISNPPFSRKCEVLRRLDELGKPFAILLPIGSLQGKAQFKIFEKGIPLLSFDRRIDFHTPQSMSATVQRPPFASAYFCRDFLPRDLIVERLDKYDRPLIEENKK